MYYAISDFETKTFKRRNEELGIMGELNGVKQEDKIFESDDRAQLERQVKEFLYDIGADSETIYICDAEDNIVNEFINKLSLAKQSEEATKWFYHSLANGMLVILFVNIGLSFIFSSSTLPPLAIISGMVLFYYLFALLKFQSIIESGIIVLIVSFLLWFF